MLFIYRLVTLLTKKLGKTVGAVIVASHHEEEKKIFFPQCINVQSNAVT